MNDALLLERLACELDSLLSGGRIDKVNMPEHDEIILSVRAHGNNYKLLISASGYSPRIHLTSAVKENPLAAPSFLMHLRKYIGGGIIESVENSKFERVIFINILHNNELMVPEKIKLAAEIMGQFSNIILVGNQNIISDCLKRVSLDMSAKRQLFPGAGYLLPPAQTKLMPSDITEIKSLLSSFTGGKIDKYLSANVGGLAPYSIREAIYRALGVTSKDTLSNEDIDKITVALNSLYTIPTQPCVTITDGAATDFLPFPYFSLESEIKYTKTISEAIELSTLEKDKLSRFNEKARPLLGQLKSAVTKNEKRIFTLSEKQREAADYEKYKIYGELILSNIYKIKKGDKKLITENFYDDNSQITIPLDENLTPSVNAQKYYKKYNKSKKTIAHSEALIESARLELDYLYSIQEAFRKCDTVTELNELKSELLTAGIITEKGKNIIKKNNKPVPPSAPLHYFVDGFDIYAGKNNIQNENLTLKTASPDDLFFHTREVHGSHVIIVTKGKEIPDSVILAAARIAANKSKAFMSDKVEVDYCRVKYIKKQKNTPPGTVTYTNHKTILVSALDIPYRPV